MAVDDCDVVGVVVVVGLVVPEDVSVLVGVVEVVGVVVCVVVAVVVGVSVAVDVAVVVVVTVVVCVLVPVVVVRVVVCVLVPLLVAVLVKDVVAVDVALVVGLVVGVEKWHPAKVPSAWPRIALLIAATTCSHVSSSRTNPPAVHPMSESISGSTPFTTALMPLATAHSADVS